MGLIHRRILISLTMWDFYCNFSFCLMAIKWVLLLLLLLLLTVNLCVSYQSLAAVTQIAGSGWETKYQWDFFWRVIFGRDHFVCNPQNETKDQIYMTIWYDSGTWTYPCLCKLALTKDPIYTFYVIISVIINLHMWTSLWCEHISYALRPPLSIYLSGSQLFPTLGLRRGKQDWIFV